MHEPSARLVHRIILDRRAPVRVPIENCIAAVILMAGERGCSICRELWSSRSRSRASSSPILSRLRCLAIAPKPVEFLICLTLHVRFLRQSGGRISNQRIFFLLKYCDFKAALEGRLMQKDPAQI